MDALKQKLQESGKEFTEKLFKTEDGIRGIGDQIFVSFGQNIIQLYNFFTACVYTGARY